MPGILGYLFTLLNVISNSMMGDILALVADTGIYSLKLYTSVRFNMVGNFQ